GCVSRTCSTPATSSPASAASTSRRRGSPAFCGWGNSCDDFRWRRFMQSCRFALILHLVVFLGGCADETKSGILIGSVLSTTGELADIGDEDLQAIELAVDQINRAGGVLHQPLLLHNIDDHTDTMRARSAADALVQEKVPAIIGAVADSSTLALADVAI